MAGTVEKSAEGKAVLQDHDPLSLECLDGLDQKILQKGLEEMKYILEQNAKMLGTENCLTQTMEECGELIQACNKVLRAGGRGKRPACTYEDAMAMLKKELVDVGIMIDELKYLLCMDAGELERIRQVSLQETNDLIFGKKHRCG